VSYKFEDGHFLHLCKAHTLGPGVDISTGTPILSFWVDFCMVCTLAGNGSVLDEDPEHKRTAKSGVCPYCGTVFIKPATYFEVVPV
jgi:hypothetical protein